MHFNCHIFSLLETYYYLVYWQKPSYILHYSFSCKARKSSFSFFRIRYIVWLLPKINDCCKLFFLIKKKASNIPYTKENVKPMKYQFRLEFPIYQRGSWSLSLRKGVLNLGHKTSTGLELTQEECP